MCSKRRKNHGVFLARNRMLTRVVAKQAKTTKVKNKFVNGKKSSKEHSVVFLVEGEKFDLGERNLGDKVQAKSSNLPRRFCSNSVGTPLEFAAFRSSFDAKYSRASASLRIQPPLRAPAACRLLYSQAKLVLFGFFCPQSWFLRRFEHILPGKTPAFSC